MATNSCLVEGCGHPVRPVHGIDYDCSFAEALAARPLYCQPCFDQMEPR